MEICCANITVQYTLANYVRITQQQYATVTKIIHDSISIRKKSTNNLLISFQWAYLNCEANMESTLIKFVICFFNLCLLLKIS